MNSIGQKLTRLRLDSMSYGSLQQQVLRRDDMAVSIVRHDIGTQRSP